MTFRIVDLMTRLDGGPGRRFRLCDVSVEDPGAENFTDTDDPTVGENRRRDDQGPSGRIRRDEDMPTADATRPAERSQECGPGRQALPLLREELRNRLQEPPALL